MTLVDDFSDLGGLLQTPLFTIGSTETTVARLFAVAAVTLATLWAARLVRRSVVRHCEKHGIQEKLEVMTASRLVGFLVYFIGFEIALHILGLRLTSLLAAGGFFALAAGFAAKNVVENFLSGIILSDRPSDRGTSSSSAISGCGSHVSGSGSRPASPSTVPSS